MRYFINLNLSQRGKVRKRYNTGYVGYISLNSPTEQCHPFNQATYTQCSLTRTYYIPPVPPDRTRGKREKGSAFFTSLHRALYLKKKKKLMMAALLRKPSNG